MARPQILSCAQKADAVVTPLENWPDWVPIPIGGQYDEHNHEHSAIKMFWKKPSQSKKPDQSQSLSNVTQTGGMIQMGQAGRDLEQSQTGDLQTQQQGLTAGEVVTLLEQLETAVQQASIDADIQAELLDYLRPAKREAGKESPDKALAGQNLKRVSETMQTLKDTTEAGKSLWQTGTDILKAVAPWIGVATAFLVP